MVKEERHGRFGPGTLPWFMPQVQPKLHQCQIACQHWGFMLWTGLGDSCPADLPIQGWPAQTEMSVQRTAFERRSRDRLAIRSQEGGRVEMTVRIFEECLDADRLKRGLLWWAYFIWKSCSERRWL